jgi:ribonuclease Z
MWYDSGAAVLTPEGHIPHLSLARAIAVSVLLSGGGFRALPAQQRRVGAPDSVTRAAADTLTRAVLKVTLLGTGSPIPRIDRFGPSILVEAGGQKLVFDVGRGAPVRLWQLRIPLRDVTAVFFTHLHSDHVTGFPDLWLTGMLGTTFGGRTSATHVFGPAGTGAMMSNLEKAYAEDIRIREADELVPPEAARIVATDIVQGAVYDSGGVRVTAFDVDHGDLIKPALGYRVDYAGHSVVLSGDTRFNENLIRYAAGADVLLHEVAMARAEALERSAGARRVIGHHTTPGEAARVFIRVKPRLAIYTHIVLLATPVDSAPTITDLVNATRRGYAGPLEVGEDLMSVEVGDSITVRRFQRRAAAAASRASPAARR